jgi:hypothetical protein
MKKSLAIILAFLISLTISAQNFEGKIVYVNIIKSKNVAVTDQQFLNMIGNMQEYYIKDGNYKSVSNGSLLQWQLYINADNKLYYKMSNSETVSWNDGSGNTDEILKSELNNAVIDILGYKCDELILTCKSGLQKYYFNSKLAVDPKLFAKHKYGNWYDYLLKSNSLPLKTIIENAQFILETTATSITPTKIDNNFFQLPANTKTEKSREQ